MKRRRNHIERNANIVLSVGIVGFLGTPVVGAICITQTEWLGAIACFALIPVFFAFIRKGLDAETL